MLTSTGSLACTTNVCSGYLNAAAHFVFFKTANKPEASEGKHDWCVWEHLDLAVMHNTDACECDRAPLTPLSCWTAAPC